MKYKNIKDTLKTGDIVLFSGKGGISTGIKWVTRSKFSHIGMVLKLEEYDYLTLWESTTLSNIKDITTNTNRQGVQLVSLSERIKTYDGEISIRKLKNVDFSTKDITSLMKLRKELKGKKYEQDEIELLKSAYDGIFGKNIEDLSSLFCSELVAEAYQRLGLLSNTIPSNEYTPVDFAQKKDISLLKGKLGKEIVING